MAVTASPVQLVDLRRIFVRFTQAVVVVFLDEVKNF
jgi:hypothetical protein